MGLSSIETTFERIAAALERIATVAEAWAQPAPILKSGTVLGDIALTPGPVVFAEHPREPVYPAATYPEAQAAVMAYIGAKGHDAGKALLAEFGVKFVKELKPEQYGAMVAKVKDATT